MSKFVTSMGFGANTYTPPAVKNIIIINFLFYLASIALPKFAGIDVIGYLGLHFFASKAFNPIQVITYMFLHDTTSFSHIFFNMFGLWMFGRGIEEALGTKRFLTFYFVSGIGAALTQEATWAITLSNMGPVPDFILNQLVTIGASGCVFGLLIAFAMLFPKSEIFLLFIPIPIKAPVFVAIYAVIELFLGLSSAADGVAHYAHLGGMLFGALLLLFWRNDDNGTNLATKIKNWFSNAFKKKPKINNNKKNSRVDEILEKIKKSGYGALTEEEKRDLFNMSK